MENLNEFIDSVQKNMKEIFQIAAIKTEEMTKLCKVRVEILGINRRIEKQLLELGGKVYHYLEEEKDKDISKKDDILRTLELVKSLKEELDEKNKELDKIKEDFDGKRKDRSEKKDIETKEEKSGE